MRIHLAEAAGDRGQFDMLVAEGCASHLLSYHYAVDPSKLDPFERVWGEMLNLHLTSTGPPDMLREAYSDSGASKHLLSYAMRNDENNIYGPAWEERLRVHVTEGQGNPESRAMLRQEGAPNRLLSYDRRNQGEEDGWQDLRARVLIDSGAYTAHTSGRPVDVREYGEWALRFAARWRGRLAFLRFFNLDVIGDQVASWRNQEVLEEMGVDPVPIVTYRAPVEHLRHALEHYPYFGLGGLVATGRAEQRRWLDHCFSEVMRFRETTGKLRRVHLLGITTRWASTRYPLYSCDSSSWTSPLRFGGGKAAGYKDKKVPRYKEGPAQRSAAMHALRHEIRKMMDLEKEATRLWESRGVVWND